MFRYLLLTILISFVFDIAKAQNPIEIVIDTDKFDDINISEFANNIEILPLINPKGESLFSVSNLILTPEHIFLNAKYVSSKDISRLLQYTKKGRFIKEIRLASSKKGDYLSFQYMFPDYTRKEIFIKLKGYYVILGFDGEIKHKKIDSPKNPILSPEFNGYRWKLVWCVDTKEEIKHNYLVKYKLEDKNIDTLYQASAALNDVEKAYRRFGKRFLSGDLPTRWHNEGEKLNLSLVIEDAILEIDKFDNARTLYRFMLKDVPLENINKVAIPGRFILDRYIIYGYNIKSQHFYYLYDKYSGEGSNVMIKRNSAGEPESGFYDDFFDTGFTNLNQAYNSEMFFYRYSEDLKQSGINTSKNSDLTLFIVKPKK